MGPEANIRYGHYHRRVIFIGDRTQQQQPELSLTSESKKASIMKIVLIASQWRKPAP